MKRGRGNDAEEEFAPESDGEEGTAAPAKKRTKPKPGVSSSKTEVVNPSVTWYRCKRAIDLTAEDDPDIDPMSDIPLGLEDFEEQATELQDVADGPDIMLVRLDPSILAQSSSRTKTKGKSRGIQEDPDDSAFEAHSELLAVLRKQRIAPLPWSANAPNAIHLSQSTKQLEQKYPGVVPDGISALRDDYFRVSASNSATSVSGLLSCPFAFDECPPFVNFLEEHKTMVGPVPTRAELNAVLDLLSRRHDLFVAESVLRKQAAQAATLRTEAISATVDTSRPASSSKPSRSGGTRGRSGSIATAADSTLDPEEIDIQDGSKRGAWEIFEAPFHRRYYRLPFVRVNTVSLDDDELSDAESIAPTTKIGVVNDYLPPWVVTFLAEWGRFFHLAAGIAFRKTLERRKLNIEALDVTERRAQSENKRSKFLTEAIRMEAAVMLFGDWVGRINLDNDTIHYAKRPPTASQSEIPPGIESQGSAKSRPPVDEDDDDPTEEENEAPTVKWYEPQIKSFIGRLFVASSRTEEKNLHKVVRFETSFRSNWRRLWKEHVRNEDAEPIIPHNVLGEHLDSFVREYTAYVRLGVETPSWVRALRDCILRTAKQIGSLSPEDLSRLAIDAPSQASYLDSVRALATVQLEREEEAMMSRADAGALRSGRGAATHREAPCDPEIADSVLPEASYGIETYATEDPTDLAQRLGIQDAQNDWLGMQSTSKADAYRRTADDTSESSATTLRSPPSWADPEAHARRYRVRVPYLNRFAPTPFDADKWQQELIQAKEEGREPTPSDLTHEELFPEVHQLAAAAQIIEAGYSDNPLSDPHFATILADQVGMGKTWLPMITMAVLRHHRAKRLADQTWSCPAMMAFKEEFMRPGEKGESRDAHAGVTGNWIGVRRGCQSNMHVMVAPGTVVLSHDLEARKVLDERYFVVRDYSQVSGERASRAFWLEVLSSSAETAPDGLRKEVVILCSYTRLVHDAYHALHPPPPASTRSPNWNIFFGEHRFALGFLDEIGVVRNPATLAHVAATRLCASIGFTIGATATPIHNTPKDVVALGRLLRMPNFVRLQPGTLRPVPMYTLPDRGDRRADDPDSFADCQPIIKEIAERIESNFAQLKSLRNRFIERRTDRDVDFEGDVPDERIWMAADWGFDPSDPAEVLMAQELATVRQELADNALAPLRALLRTTMIRRGKQSKGPDGAYLSLVQDVTPEIVTITLTPEEQRAYETYKESLKESDNRFVVQSRRFLKAPFAARTGYWNPKEPCPPVVRELRKRIKATLRQDYNLPDAAKRKVIIFWRWTSFVPLLQGWLSQAGIASKAMTGLTPWDERRAIMAAFERDANHPADPIASCIDSIAAVVFRYPRGSRVLIVTDMGGLGITLIRGSEVHITDPNWADATTVQTLGRVNRIGQRRPIHAFLYYCQGTVEDRLVDLSAMKRQATDAFFLGDRGSNDQAALENIQAVLEDGDEDQLLPDLATARKFAERRRRKLVESALEFNIPLENSPSKAATVDAATSEADELQPIPKAVLLAALSTAERWIWLFQSALSSVQEKAQNGEYDLDRLHRALSGYKLENFKARIEKRLSESEMGEDDGSAIDLECEAFLSVARSLFPTIRANLPTLLPSLLDYGGRITARSLSSFPASWVISRGSSHAALYKPSRFGDPPIPHAPDFVSKVEHPYADFASTLLVGLINATPLDPRLLAVAFADIEGYESRHRDTGHLHVTYSFVRVRSFLDRCLRTIYTGKPTKSTAKVVSKKEFKLAKRLYELLLNVAEEEEIHVARLLATFVDGLGQITRHQVEGSSAAKELLDNADMTIDESDWPVFQNNDTPDDPFAEQLNEVAAPLLALDDLPFFKEWPTDPVVVQERQEQQARAEAEKKQKRKKKKKTKEKTPETLESE